MSVEQLMEEIKSALPEKTLSGREMIRDVCLTLNREGNWQALAGGRPWIHIGEYGGDYAGDGTTAEEALTALLKAIRE